MNNPYLQPGPGILTIVVSDEGSNIGKGGMRTGHSFTGRIKAYATDPQDKKHQILIIQLYEDTEQGYEEN